MSIWKKFRAARGLLLKQSTIKWGMYWKHFRAARATFFLSNPEENEVYIYYTMKNSKRGRPDHLLQSAFGTKTLAKVFL